MDYEFKLSLTILQIIVPLTVGGLLKGKLALSLLYIIIYTYHLRNSIAFPILAKDYEWLLGQ